MKFITYFIFHLSLEKHNIYLYMASGNLYLLCLLHHFRFAAKNILLRMPRSARWLTFSKFCANFMQFYFIFGSLFLYLSIYLLPSLSKRNSMELAKIRANCAAHILVQKSQAHILLAPSIRQIIKCNNYNNSNNNMNSSNSVEEQSRLAVSACNTRCRLAAR